MCRPGFSGMMRRLCFARLNSIIFTKQLVNLLRFCDCLFVSQKVRISSVNSFHAQISRIVFSEANHDSIPRSAKFIFLRAFITSK